MIKVMILLRRRPEMEPEAFSQYWHEKHAPLVRTHAAALNVRRYVQNHGAHAEVTRASVKHRGMDESYDGIAELWFDSLDSMLAGARSPAGREANRLLLEDEARFIAMKRSTILFAEEREIPL